MVLIKCIYLTAMHVCLFAFEESTIYNVNGRNSFNSTIFVNDWYSMLLFLSFRSQVLNLFENMVIFFSILKNTVLLFV